MFEMSRRTEPADVADELVTQVPDYFTEYRVFPETYTKVFDAFESGQMERFRRIQPAVIATTHLIRAEVYGANGDHPSASARYDSARVHYEWIIRSNPQSAYICFYHAALGLAYAGLGRKAEAIREGEKAARMMPVSQDALVGAELARYLAEIYVKCGEYEAAIDQIEMLLSIPSLMSSGLLRVDPIWDPIRSDPRFRRLVEGT